MVIFITVPGYRSSSRNIFLGSIDPAIKYVAIITKWVHMDDQPGLGHTYLVSTVWHVRGAP